MRTRVFMRTPQWNGDDGLTASTVAPGKFQRRLFPVELFQARFPSKLHATVTRDRSSLHFHPKTSSQRIAESCVNGNIIVIIMNLWNCRFSVTKSRKFRKP